jgi:hypothetical protein
MPAVMVLHFLLDGLNFDRICHKNNDQSGLFFKDSNG